jgi:hypothetical protein
MLYEFSVIYFAYCISGKLLLQPASTLSKKPVLSWTTKDVMPIARLLAGRTAIDGTGDNATGAWALHHIGEDLDHFIDEHPKIRAIIDPIYVVADLVGAAPPQQHVNAYPPPGSPAPALTPFAGSNYVWGFTGRNAASHVEHFIGWMRGRVPGLRMFAFATRRAVTYW